MTEHSTSRRLILSSTKSRRSSTAKNQFTRDIDEVEDERKKENNTNLFSNIALNIILSDHPELTITKRLNSLEDKKNSFLAKMKKIDELQEKVKNGEMPGVEGIRELLKVMEEVE